jgi:hypothetical protein
MKSVHLLVVLAFLSLGMLIGSCASVDQPGEAEGLNADPCTGATVSFVEAEPNNGTTEADHNVVETEDGNLIITGSSASCGNDGTTWTGDIDVFEVNYGCGGIAEVRLSWTSVSETAGDDDDSAESPVNSADLDYSVLARDISTTHYAAVGYNWGNSSGGGTQSTSTDLEEASGVELAGPLRVSIMCWSGEVAQDWAFTIDWDNSSVAGDDDDSSAL